MAKTLPMAWNIENGWGIVVGGGGVGTRKAISLLEAGARVRVVSPEISTELKLRVQNGEIEWAAEPFLPSHLEGASLVFAAADRREVNAEVTQEAKRRGIPVSVADAPEDGNFTSPAVLRRGSLVLTVSTEGGSPALTAYLLQHLEEQFGEEWAEFVELLSALRDYIKREVSPSVRATIQRRLITERAVLNALLISEGREAAERAGEQMIERWREGAETGA